VLGFDIVEDLCGELRDRGCSDSISVMVANKNYGGLSAELRSMRIIDSSYQPSKQKTGQRSIGFETPEIGEIEVVIHPFMAWGDVYLQQDQQMARVGSADIGFGVPGLPNNGKEQFLRNVQDGNAPSSSCTRTSAWRTSARTSRTRAPASRRPARNPAEGLLEPARPTRTASEAR
jgi:hypothetical protein